jgi:hypothetical protein
VKCDRILLRLARSFAPKMMTRKTVLGDSREEAGFANGSRENEEGIRGNDDSG